MKVAGLRASVPLTWCTHCSGLRRLDSAAGYDRRRRLVAGRLWEGLRVNQSSRFLSNVDAPALQRKAFL